MPESCECSTKIAVNIPVIKKPRIVVVGGGFAGLYLVRGLKNLDVQVVLIDSNNYHTFQPLLYQVATAALEPQSIACPFREIFRNQKNFYFRMADVIRIDAPHNHIETSIGLVDYDYLVIASGTESNYFGMEDVKAHTMAMKNISEAIALRHLILGNFEKALLVQDVQRKESLMNVVVIGGGPTGIEVAGAIGELKNYILPKDYPELDFKKMQIHIMDMEERLLKSLSPRSSRFAAKSLQRFGVNIWLNAKVKSYDGYTLTLADDKKLHSQTVIWAAGIKGKAVPGLLPECILPNDRIKVDGYNKAQGYSNIFAVGDVAAMISEEYSKGHPMLAPVAIQQAKRLAKNFKCLLRKEKMRAFVYKDYGVMATIGRNHAIVDMKFFKLYGALAWFIWVFFHIMTLVGFRNRVVAFVNWLWNYISYDRAVRLIINPFARDKKEGFK